MAPAALVPTLFIPGLGLPELVILFVIVLILFGPGKLPDVCRAVGDGIRQFKKAAHEGPGESQPEQPKS